MTEFVIYPAIDIRDGKCVRLLQGDYNQETIYGDSPVEMAKRWQVEGAAWVHLVDLDGAKAGEPANDAVILEIAQELSIPVQVGGGIRNLEHVQKYLDGGVARVILGTAAIKDKPFVEAALKKYGGGKIAIGIDARGGYVATHGWLETSEVRAEQLAAELAKLGAETFIYTDIARDGTLTGPNVEEIVGLAKTAKVQVLASGGVSVMNDLRELAEYASAGVCGAIVGKALYTDRIRLTDAVREVEVK